MNLAHLNYASIELRNGICAQSVTHERARLYRLTQHRSSGILGMYAQPTTGTTPKRESESSQVPLPFFTAVFGPVILSPAMGLSLVLSNMGGKTFRRCFSARAEKHRFG